MKLVISLATRGRPQQVVETIARSTPNLALPNTMMMVQVDDDDVATIDALNRAKLDGRVRVNVKPREDTIAGKWNRALAEPADLYLWQQMTTRTSRQATTRSCWKPPHCFRTA